MLLVPLRCVLVSLRDCAHLVFAIKTPDEGETGQGAVGAESVGEDQSRLPGEVGCNKLRTSGSWTNDDVHLLENFVHRLHGEHTRAIRVDVLDGWDESSRAKRVGPVIFG